MNMDNHSEGQLLYERQLLLCMTVFLNAIQMYAQWANKAISSVKVSQDAKFRDGMEELILVIKNCGVQFQKLPHPSADADEVDHLIRDLGKNIEGFSASLGGLSGECDPQKRRQQGLTLEMQTVAIKQEYRQFVDLYERKYPGRLAAALGSMKETLSSI